MNGKGRLASRGYGGCGVLGELPVRLGRAAGRVTTTICGATGPFVTSHAYDSLGRLSTTTYPSELKVEYGYNARGYVTTLKDATTMAKRTLVAYGAMDAYGNIETETFGNGAVTSHTFDAKTGRPTAIRTARGTSTFQDHAYGWRTDGSLDEGDGGTAANARMPTARETFLYGPNGARYRKTSEWRVGDGDTAVLKSETTYYAGAYEKRTRACTTGEGKSSTESVERTRVGPVLHVKRTPCGNSSAAPAEIEYRHFDHLGSSASITDAAGAELVALAHDPHGERRKPDWTRRLSESEIAALGTDHGDRTSRGFTGHEHLDRTGLVHMNGRLYDPLLGRFLSPDPIVANPADGQQWNLYSYAGNSPLSYVDPSGLSFCDPAQQSWCGGVGLPSPPGAGGGYSTRTVSGWSVYVTFGTYYDVPGTDATNPAKRRGWRWVRNRVGFLVPTGDGAWFDGDSTKRCRARMLTIECQHRHRAV